MIAEAPLASVESVQLAVAAAVVQLPADVETLEMLAPVTGMATLTGPELARRCAPSRCT
jgi:hypothetical protein